MEAGDPRHLLLEIARILERLRIPYMVTGGMAVFVWGHPRFTADIDIVVELTEKNIEGLANELRGIDDKGYLDKDAIYEALKNRGEFNYLHGETGIKVDFWILKEGIFEKQRLARRIAKKILGRSVYREVVKINGVN